MDRNAPLKTLKVFGWASFLNDFGSDIIFPLWPLFLTSVLGANMEVLGFIDGLGNALVSVSQAVSGYFADKTGKRKIFVWLGYVFAGLSRIGYALSSTWPCIIPFRILDRAGKMRGAPRDAIIADISTDGDRGKNFGYLRMMDNLGAVCGIIFTIIFFKYFGYQKLFLIAAVPSLAGAVLVFCSIREHSGAGNKIFKGITFKHFHRDLKLYILLSTVFTLGSFSYSFLLIYARQYGFSIVAMPVLYLIYSAVASLVSLPFGKLADKVNRKPVLILSFLFWLLTCVTFIYFHNPVAIIMAFLLYGLHLGAIEPVQRALVSELAISQFRASTLGTFQMVTGLAALPASLIAGILWHRIDINAPFYFSAFLTVLAIIMMLFVQENRNAPKVPKRAVILLVGLAGLMSLIGIEGPVFAGSSLRPTAVLMPAAEGGTGFDDLNFSSDLHKILVPGGRTGKLYLVDPRTKEISVINGFSSEKNYSGGHRQSITSADEGAGFIFTTDRSALKINVVDLQAKAVVASASLAGGPDYVRFIASTSEVWVTQPADERIEIFSFSTKPIPKLFHSGFIDVPGGPESLMVDHTRRLGFTHLWEGMTEVIAIHTHKIVHQWPNGCRGSRGMVLDEKRGFLFAGCSEGKAVVLDVDHDGRQLGSLSTGPGVDVIGYNPGLSHLYLSSADSATLSVIGVSAAGKPVLLGTGNAVKGAHCVSGDDQGNIWVCDPLHGQLLLYKDSF